MKIPELIMLCGLPGSGKTTYAEHYKDTHNCVHMSSDNIRSELYGDPSIQGDPNEVFGVMNSRTVELLNKGQSVIYDATNLTRKSRASIISMCPKPILLECVITWNSIEQCIENDKNRDRHVGERVIDRMVKSFQAPFYDEGFHSIRVVTGDYDAGKYVGRSLASMRIPHDNPNHTLNILSHCEEAAKYLENKGANRDLTQAAILHDIGKPYTKSFTDSKGNPTETAHYYQHQNVGAWMSYGFEKDVYTAWLISTHMEPYFNSKYYRNLPEYLKRDIDLLNEADRNAH